LGTVTARPDQVESSSRHPTRAVRHWMVIGPKGELLCLTVYERGAQEVVRRLAA
jgi:hypothetical protein